MMVLDLRVTQGIHWDALTDDEQAEHQAWWLIWRGPEWERRIGGGAHG
jgi:hypothetical protein